MLTQPLTHYLTNARQKMAVPDMNLVVSCFTLCNSLLPTSKGKDSSLSASQLESVMMFCLLWSFYA